MFNEEGVSPLELAQRKFASLLDSDFKIQEFLEKQAKDEKRDGAYLKTYGATPFAAEKIR